MGAVGPALELGVILHAHIEGSVAQFHGLYQLTIRGKAAHGQARRAQGIPVVIIELIAMAVALPDLRTPITPRHRRSSGDHTGVAAQTEGAAFVDCLALTRHKVDDLMRTFRVKFARIGVRDTAVSYTHLTLPTIYSV